MLPSAWDAASVTTGISTFLTNPIIASTVVLLLGVSLAPRIVKGVRRAIGR